MRKILSIMFLVLLGFAVCAEPKRAMLGSRGEDAEEQSLTASDYIQDGLVAMWDGIENVDWGIHDSTSPYWVDLVKGIQCPVNGFNADSAIMGIVSLTNAHLLDALDSPNMTIEMFTVCGVSPLSSRIAPIIVTPETSYFSFCYYRWGTAVNYATGFYRLFGQQNKWYKHFPREGDVETIRFTLTRDGASVKAYYYNGDTLDVYSYSATEPTVPPTELRFWRAGNPDVYFVRIYDRTLSEKEVYHNYAIDQIRFSL